MQIVEVWNNVVIVKTPFEAITNDMPDFYKEAPDEVQPGWVYDPVMNTYSDPGPVPPPEPPPMGLEQATAIMTAVNLGVPINPETQAKAQAAMLGVAQVTVDVPETGAWKPGEWVDVGTVRTYNGTNYKCRQAHMTQADWTPSATPALWTVVQAEPEPGQTLPWVAGETVSAGDLRTYNGKTYKCIQGHTTQTGWEPPNVPALWQKI